MCARCVWALTIASTVTCMCEKQRANAAHRFGSRESLMVLRFICKNYYAETTRERFSIIISVDDAWMVDTMCNGIMSCALYASTVHSRWFSTCARFQCSLRTFYLNFAAMLHGVSFLVESELSYTRSKSSWICGWVVTVFSVILSTNSNQFYACREADSVISFVFLGRIRVNF